jgi:hypothetical protein
MQSPRSLHGFEYSKLFKLVKKVRKKSHQIEVSRPFMLLRGRHILEYTTQPSPQVGIEFTAKYVLLHKSDISQLTLKFRSKDSNPYLAIRDKC